MLAAAFSFVRCCVVFFFVARDKLNSSKLNSFSLLQRWNLMNISLRSNILSTVARAVCLLCIRRIFAFYFRAFFFSLFSCTSSCMKLPTSFIHQSNSSDRNHLNFFSLYLSRSRSRARSLWFHNRKKNALIEITFVLNRNRYLVFKSLYIYIPYIWIIFFSS